MGAVVLDGAGLNEALDAQLAVIGLVAHPRQLADGDVVALVGAVAGVRQPGDGADDHGNRDSDAKSVRGSFHRLPLTIRALSGKVNLLASPYHSASSIAAASTSSPAARSTPTRTR